ASRSLKRRDCWRPEVMSALPPIADILGHGWGLPADGSVSLLVDQHQRRPDIERLRLNVSGSTRSKALMLNDRRSNTSKAGKNEICVSSVCLVRYNLCCVRKACLVLWASDGNGKASTCKY